MQYIVLKYFYNYLVKEVKALFSLRKKLLRFYLKYFIQPLKKVTNNRNPCKILKNYTTYKNE